MRGAPFLVLFAASLLAQRCSAADFYPNTREVILEAEAVSSGAPVMRDSKALMHKAAALLSRAGYLDDAAQTLKKVGGSEIVLIRPRTLYGDSDGARRLAMAQADPELRTDLLENIADMLWRMGSTEKARVVLDEARNASQAVVNPSHRKTRLQTIDQLSAALSSDPPSLLSNEPRPAGRIVPVSTVPPFPVTTDGFRNKDPNAVTAQAREDADFMTRLYALAAAGNRDGLLRLAESASNPFRKMLAWANLEHVFIQLGAPAEAEEYARLISEDRADSVGKELAFGRGVVVTRVAEAEAAAGLTANLSATFDLALDLARLAPPHSKPVNGVYPKGYFEEHQRQEDVYRLIFSTAVKARDLPDARKAGQRWHESSAGAANRGIVTNWVEDGRMDEALAYARGISDRGERAAALLDLAEEWLNTAGAPRF
jgi:hypothetical protein